MNKIQSYRNSIWFLWIVLTAIYLLIYLLSGVEGPLVEKIVFTVGLFVPIGFWNGGAIVSSIYTLYFLPILVLILFFLGMFILEKVSKKYGITGVAKFIFNMVFLFAFTILFDLAIWRCWASLEILVGSSGCFSGISG